VGHERLAQKGVLGGDYVIKAMPFSPVDLPFIHKHHYTTGLLVSAFNTVLHQASKQPMKYSRRTPRIPRKPEKKQMPYNRKKDVIINHNQKEPFQLNSNIPPNSDLVQ
jgi:hypothetical protein